MHLCISVRKPVVQFLLKKNKTTVTESKVENLDVRVTAETNCNFRVTAMKGWGERKQQEICSGRQKEVKHSK